MIRFLAKKNNNKKNEKAYGKYYAKPVVEETVDIDGLSEHMDNHNSPFSKGTIKGILTDACVHIKELLLLGKNVKLDDLAIFSIGIKNKVGAESEEAFSVTKNIEGVKLRARATGELTSANLNLEANLKKATTVKSASSSTGGGSTTTPSGGGSGSQGSGSQGGGSQGSGSGTPSGGSSGTGSEGGQGGSNIE